jgi:hypothetical protein
LVKDASDNGPELGVSGTEASTTCNIVTLSA